jgi:hypothetical protein
MAVVWAMGPSLPVEQGACDNPGMQCPVIVGRDEELATLAGVLSRAAGGRGGCVVVSGEAGVGKTRLVTEAATGARGRGQVVLAGRSTPTDRVSPLRPLGEALLDGLRDRRRPDDPVLAPYLPALGTLVPHWAAGPAFPAVPPAPVVLAEAMLRVASWLSPERGAVVVLEDMHWADRETLTVLEYLADHVTAFPVAVVLTVRSDEPGTSGLGSRVARGAPHLRLAPLADSEVAAMAAACLGVDAAPAAILAGLRQNAAGLPLLVEDLVGVAGHPGPVRYAEIISGRLARLDAAVSEVEAELARATAGARFPASWLGYAHAVTLAAAGDAAAAEAAFGRAERAASRYPLFRAIALRLAAEAALQHPFGDPVGWPRGRSRVRVPPAAPDRQRLPRPARPGRGADHPAARPAAGCHEQTSCEPGLSAHRGTRVPG